MSFFLVSTSNGKLSMKANSSYPLNSDSSLLVYYTFEDVSGNLVFNKKTNNYDASLNGTANSLISTSTYKNGTRSLSPTGASNSWLINSNRYNVGLNGFTIACWFNISSTNFNSGGYLWSFNNYLGDASGNAYFLNLTVDDSNYLLINSNSNGINWGRNGGKYTTSLSLNTWYHVVVCISSPTPTPLTSYMYVNGSLVQTLNLTSNGGTYPVASDGIIERLAIGGYYNSGGISTNTAFNGYIDDYRLYNRVLSAAEITSLYNYK